jgi:ParB family chromosome partitioning protein
MNTSFHAALAVATTAAERLAAIMLKGESMRAFAERVGIDHAQVSKLQSGKLTDLSLDTWRTIAATTGLPLALLIGDVDAVAPAAAAPAAGLTDVPWGLIDPSPLNPRKIFDPESIEELAASIEKAGILQNLVVRPKSGRLDDPQGYWLISGERRYRAVRHLIETSRLGMNHPMPCRVVVADDREHLRMAVVENLQRQDVAPLEEAEAFKALREAGWATDEIAQECGKTRRFVQLRLGLVEKLVPELQAQLRDGKISAEIARVMATAEPKAQKDVAKSGYLPRTADDARQRLRGHGSVPAELCRFDPAAYKGPRYEDDTGALHYLDKKQVVALQLAWAKDETKRMVDAGEVTWAEVVEGYVSPGEADLTDDPARVGCVLRVTYTGDIEQIDGLDRGWWEQRQQKETAQGENAANAVARNAAFMARKAAEDAAAVACEARMRIALTEADEGTRLRLTLAITLYALHAGHDDPLGLRRIYTDPLRQLVGEVPVDDNGEIVCGVQELIIAALLRSSTCDLFATLTDIVAGQLRVRGPYGGLARPHVKLLADALGVEIPVDLLEANVVRDDEPHGDDDQLDIEDAIDAAGDMAGEVV